LEFTQEWNDNFGKIQLVMPGVDIQVVCIMVMESVWERDFQLSGLEWLNNFSIGNPITHFEPP
jgi:hypothetical protein